MVSGTTVAVQVVVDGTTRVAAAGATHVLSCIIAAASHVHCLSRVSTPAGADGGGVMALDEGDAACPSSSDKLNNTTHRLRGWVDALMLISLSSC